MFGWVQYSVPPGQFGVIISKTHGVDPLPVRSGEFRWIWYKLLPTNVRVVVFSLVNAKFPVNFSSMLPSGDTYATFAGMADADFSWNLHGEIAFSINPDSLVSITQQQNLNSQEDLDNYLQIIAKDIETLILRELSSSGTATASLERIMSGYTDQQLEQEIRKRFPEIMDFSFVISSALYPDFMLYGHLRQLYEHFLDSQRDFIASSFGGRAQSHIETQIRIRELEQYGDLLTRFPVLLDYIQLENNINRNR